MEQRTQHEREILKSQIRECYGRVVYSHKVHEKAADILANRLHNIKLMQILFSALTTGSLLYQIFSGNRVGTIVAAVLSTILFIINIYTKEYNLAELSQKHHAAAQKIWDVRESYLCLLVDLSSEKDVNVVRNERDKLQDKLNHIYSDAPRTFDQAYKQAQKALKINQELTFSDDEIDKFLPETLHKPRKEYPSS